MTVTDRAMHVASLAHGNQVYDIYPYIYHIEMVRNILEDVGVTTEVVVAGILHDVLEDSELSFNDIRKAFGENVAEIVYAVTDELGRNRKERKEKTYPKIRNNNDAITVKLADRLANVMHGSLHGNVSLTKMYLKEWPSFLNELGLLNTTDEIHVHLIGRIQKVMNEVQ